MGIPLVSGLDGGQANKVWFGLVVFSHLDTVIANCVALRSSVSPIWNSSCNKSIKFASYRAVS